MKTFDDFLYEIAVAEGLIEEGKWGDRMKVAALLGLGGIAGATAMNKFSGPQATTATTATATATVSSNNVQISGDNFVIKGSAKIRTSLGPGHGMSIARQRAKADAYRNLGRALGTSKFKVYGTTIKDIQQDGNTITITIIGTLKPNAMTKSVSRDMGSDVDYGRGGYDRDKPNYQYDTEKSWNWNFQKAKNQGIYDWWLQKRDKKLWAELYK